ncbi:MAG: LPS export ABC transporter permease LptF [Proteobacteria bacterium]|nr:LPS export ABC transporter permease LptF [Pseudomonadota bacterium]
MIIRDYIIKEILRSFLGVFIILFLIILSTQLIKSLSLVAKGQISVDFLLALISYKNIESLTLLVPLALFIAVLLAISRLYKDSEMIALSSCGVGPVSLLKSVMIIVVSFIFFEMGLALIIAPWASSNIQIAQEEYQAKAVMEFIEAGQFNFSSDASRVLYAESFSDKSHLDNVFLYIDNNDKNKNDRSSVLASKNASFIIDPRNGSRYIVFNEGHRYDGSPGSLDYRHVRFKDYGVLLEGKAIGKISFERKALSLDILLSSDNLKHKAELQWRISQVLMMIILAMLAVPLSKSRPRQGRYGKMAIAILLYVVYSNLLLVALNWMKKGKVEPYIGLWWVHFIFMVLFLVLFLYQMGWFNSLKKRRQDEFEDLVST